MGRVADLHVPRRSLVASLLAAPFLVASCSKDDKPAPRASSTTTTTTTTTTAAPPKPKVTGKGLPADLLAVTQALYLGGKVPALASVGKALGKRKVRAKSIAVAGSTGAWKGTPVAVVTYGKDVTLLVKDKRWTVVGGWWPSLGVARVPLKPMRVLAIGSDARNHQRVEACRADALQLIGVDNQGVGGIVGIPRDSYVPISGGGTDKINAALVLRGVRGQVRTVEQATGLTVDGYVMTGFKGFRAMVKALGGITFVAASSLRSVDNYQIVKAGRNTLNSKTALGLARERKHLPNGDFGRSTNQGLIIKAGIAMAQARGPAHLPKYLTAMGPHLQTDLNAAQVLTLCSAVYIGKKASSIRTGAVPGGVGMRAGQSVVLLGSRARSIFADLRDGRLGA